MRHGRNIVLRQPRASLSLSRVVGGGQNYADSPLGGVQIAGLRNEAVTGGNAVSGGMNLSGTILAACEFADQVIGSLALAGLPASLFAYVDGPLGQISLDGWLGTVGTDAPIGSLIVGGTATDHWHPYVVPRNMLLAVGDSLAYLTKVSA